MGRRKVDGGVIRRADHRLLRLDRLVLEVLGAHRSLMIAIALPMPSACTTRFCASRCSISISVCFRSGPAWPPSSPPRVGDLLRVLDVADHGADDGEGRLLGEGPHALGDQVADLGDPVLDLEPVQLLDSSRA